MNEIIQLVTQHQVWATIIGGGIWNAFVGSLPAPADNSSQAYKFFFKFANALALNFHRAANTSIESSPNFLPAVEKYLQAQADAKARLTAVTDWQQIPSQEKK